MEKKKIIKEFMYISRHYFNKETNKVYAPNQMGRHLTNIKKISKLPQRIKTAEMIEILESSEKLKRIELSFPSKKYTRYTWGEKSIYEILLSLDVNAYYSHLSALFFHGLFEQDIVDFYVNIEQSEKPKYRNTMLQENIDKAFSRPPRITNNMTTYQQKWRIFLLNGKHTNNMGVINMKGPQKSKIFVTDLERTLIDIAVRPNYSGGVSNVMTVYKKAIKNVSLNKMVSMLKKLDYSYPYHQSIGFYIENAGFVEESNIFRKSFPIKFNFYLDHQIVDTEYSENWRVFYPKDLLRITRSDKELHSK